jgi:hypothetical protein
MPTPAGSSSVLPSSTGVSLPSTWIPGASLLPGSARHTATLVVPKRAATALFTVASGQVGAPDTCRV